MRPELLAIHSAQHLGATWRGLVRDEVFGNLHGIERGSLANLVAAEPEGESVVTSQVFANAAHVDVVVPGCLEGHGIDTLSRIVF